MLRGVGLVFTQPQLIMFKIYQPSQSLIDVNLLKKQTPILDPLVTFWDLTRPRSFMHWGENVSSFWISALSRHLGTAMEERAALFAAFPRINKSQS